eukprot:272288-Chlamydomonas_euryale.AAC.1
MPRLAGCEYVQVGQPMPKLNPPPSRNPPEGAPSDLSIVRSPSVIPSCDLQTQRVAGLLAALHTLVGHTQLGSLPSDSDSAPN